MILPEENRADYEDLDEHITKGITLRFVRSFDDVRRICFPKGTRLWPPCASSVVVISGFVLKLGDPRRRHAQAGPGARPGGEPLGRAPAPPLAPRSYSLRHSRLCVPREKPRMIFAPVLGFSITSKRPWESPFT